MASLPACSAHSYAYCSRKQKTYFWDTHGHSLSYSVSGSFTHLLLHKTTALLSPSCIQLIHVTLLESPKFSSECCPTLNPATLIPNSSEPPTHTKDLIAHFSHISSVPLNNPDLTWCIDCSSYTIPKGKRVAGYAIVSDTEVIESQPLPVGNSSQKAELLVLTRALTLAANK